MRKQTTALSKQKKETFYCAKLDAAGGSQKALFATVKELAGLKEKPVFPSSQSDEELEQFSTILYQQNK